MFPDRKLLSAETANESVAAGTTDMPEVTTVEEILPATPSNVCIPPAIIQFPSPGIDQKARRQGGVIFHILVATYMFVGLAIVCDDYFVPALTRVSDGKSSYFVTDSNLL